MSHSSAVAAGATRETRHPQRIRTLDGLRAIAILFVLFDHYIPRVLVPHGPVSSLILSASAWASSGVDLFFVLSGFLITGILLEAKGSSNYFRRFYWRRSLRIFPAFYALLLFLHYYGPIVFDKIHFAWFALYLRNWLGADRNSDGSLGHLWSLAVEEQFYIAWSVVVFFCPSRYLLRVTLVLMAAAPVVRALMHYAGYPGYLIFRVTPARMEGLLSGAMVAIGTSSGWILRRKGLAFAGLLTGFAGSVLLTIFSKTAATGDLLFQVAWPSLVMLLYASALLLSLNLREGSAAYAFLASAPLRAVAKYSYAIYLWHLAMAAFAMATLLEIEKRHPLSPDWHAFAFCVLGFAYSWIVAVASWVIIERPALGLKNRLFPSIEFNPKIQADPATE